MSVSMNKEFLAKLKGSTQGVEARRCNLDEIQKYCLGF